MNSGLQFETHSDEETRALGSGLAKLLPKRSRPINRRIRRRQNHSDQGHCRRARAAAADDVSSPTFTLIHEYGQPVIVYHVDLYRLDTVEEARRLGLEDLFEQPALVLSNGESASPS